MIAWIADFFRFWWSLFYWNAAKTLFRRRIVKHCPCQAPSDSGRARETRCEACVTWNRPARFKRVCPLLVDTPDGLLCSVDTADVRPFWRLTAAWTGGALAACYVAAVLFAFAGLRLLGYPVGIVNLAWPGRWHRLNEARSEYYFEKGTTGFARGDLRTAGMSLYLAYQLDPKRYDIGLMLGEIATLSMPDRADGVYAMLMTQHPRQASQTAQAWMRSALERGNFSALRAIALERLRNGAAPQAPWLHALLFATRQLDDLRTIRELGSTTSGARWRTLLRTEADLREGRRDRALASLEETWYPIDSYNAYYQTHELLALGHPTEALITLAAYQSVLPGEEQSSVRLSALKLLSSPADWRTQTQGMLEHTTVSPGAVEFLAGYLFSHPDATLLAEVSAWLRKKPLPTDDGGIRAYLALYFASGACGDKATMDWIATVLRTQSSNRYYFLETVKRYFLDPNSRIRPSEFLTLVPLPLEMVYAVWQRDNALARHPASQPGQGAAGSGGSLNAADARP